MDTDKIVEIVEDNILDILSDFDIDLNQEEKGHALAPLVQNKVISLLDTELPKNNMHGKKPNKVRANEDYIISGHSTNIKFGWVGYGQPNICAMNRILNNYVFKSDWKEKIEDGYWLLKIKVMKEDLSDIRVNMVNLFNIVECLQYNQGPGQIMLKERQFYELSKIPILDIRKSVSSIKELYIKQCQHHMELKKKQFEQSIKKFPI